MVTDGLDRSSYQLSNPKTVAATLTFFSDGESPKRVSQVIVPHIPSPITFDDTIEGTGEYPLRTKVLEIEVMNDDGRADDAFYEGVTRCMDPAAVADMRGNAV